MAEPATEPPTEPPSEPLDLPDFGHAFVRPALLRQALTHSSWVHEHRGVGAEAAYERLEFLGDAVLQLLVSEHLYDALPDAPEGTLSQRRAQLVRAPTLAALARRLDLGRHVRVGSGADVARVPDRVLADVLEAVLGAVYLDGGSDGLACARRFFRPLLGPALNLARAHVDHKTRLQEACHRLGLPEPRYVAHSVTGPAHGRTFHVTLTVGANLSTEGSGTSKKAAEQLCAERALCALS